MPQSEYKIHSSAASTLSYTPVKELDFGTILCWAENVVGQQKEPCVFHLIAAGKPDVPYNCTIVNQTSESLEVECNEGNDLIVKLGCVIKTCYFCPTFIKVSMEANVNGL